MNKEVICIEENFDRFTDPKGNAMHAPVKTPKKGEIYTVDYAEMHKGELYYHIPGLDEVDNDCLWDATDFADLTGLMKEIDEALANDMVLRFKKPPEPNSFQEWQRIFGQPSHHRQPADYIFDPLKYGNWLHIDHT